MRTYEVTARRSGDWWALEVPELPGVFSQAKRLDQADEVVREAIAAMTDVEPEDVRVRVAPVLSAEEREALARVREARAESERAAAKEREAMQSAAAMLAEGLSQRDTGRILGVSFQRVSQLIKERSKGEALKAEGAKTNRGSRRAESDRAEETAAPESAPRGETRSAA
ncbi:type II toxin-antitoxin system HicB family antitoxin [Streptomyces sp. XM4193]|uniref:type II toxin-antitoxin system HicB family antitoxin n=1 Tax=Streptomyces sp. XM4193 TaxID=2929782 RepID=UPI001FF966A2|nr:type II toxin-antitoxin system HicB family antitoxin [Streptomyces sp. XM4193]MCK1798165.1 type II toxin-antitoxin system HicB family antitoxin [Streptomyces sp. XM4193]